MISRHLPRSSALYRAMYPDTAEWSLEAQISADTFDAVQAGNWQRQGKAHAPRPKPYPRPWVKPDVERIGGEALPIDEMNRRLGWEVTP